MGYRCVVLAKQVPDTKKVTGKAMKDDGTVNRAALPAIFNPEDLNALEAALEIRDTYGGEVILMTMSIPRAAEILREGLCRGVDRAILITDRRAAGSDTLATSHILSCAVRKLGDFDLVLCGRQAIDGDTAQVGPQLAEKLGITQVTYFEKLESLGNGKARIRRNVGHGWELVEGDLPLLVTVTSEANTPRPPAARRLMKYKSAMAPSEVQQRVVAEMEGQASEKIAKEAGARCDALKRRGLLIEQWGLDGLDVDEEWIGLSGSPTKVHRIQSVVLTGGEYRNVPPTEHGIRDLVHELIEDHTIG